MDLRTYRKQQGLTLDQFGRGLGVSGVTVHRWEKGKALPSLKQAAEIQRQTAGKVTVADLMPEAEAA